jgi:hypothetical protein
MTYEDHILHELRLWQKKMMRNPSAVDKLSKRMQTKMNSYIPDKVHNVITGAIKQMVRGVLFGATHTNVAVSTNIALVDIEENVLQRIDFYKKASAVEGGVTGAGGILLGLADFPILLSLKLKMLFEIAALYGHSVKDYKERLFILHIFQLAFSSQEHRQQVYHRIVNWEIKKESLPTDINEFQWRPFQQEYRDYIDLAKLAQLIPGIGAVVGFVVNYRLLKKLGETAMNAYRLRWAEKNMFITNS